jgi:peptide chain release factor 2
MQETKEEIRTMYEDFTEVVASLDIPGKEVRLKELEAKSTDEALWEDAANAKNIMQEMGDLKHEIEEVKNIQEELDTLKSLADSGDIDESVSQDLKNISERISDYKLKALLSAEYDKKNAIVSIHAGQGGTEAMDWTSMLYRMYLRYCEKRNWKTKVIDVSEGEEAGIKSVTFVVVGEYSYGYLKRESGTHRLVRQSPFNADKLRQTSFALVEVLPEFEEMDVPDIEINDDDLEWQFFRSSTQGGQNVQKVSTAVRVKHTPTGIVTTAQTERYQEQNRRIALTLLKAKLWVLEKEKRAKKVSDIKGEYRPASWGTQIRSYVLHPYKMVKDLRTLTETSDTESVLDGNLDDFIQAELLYDN